MDSTDSSAGFIDAGLDQEGLDAPGIGEHLGGSGRNTARDGCAAGREHPFGGVRGDVRGSRAGHGQGITSVLDRHGRPRSDESRHDERDAEQESCRHELVVPEFFEVFHDALIIALYTKRF